MIWDIFVQDLPAGISSVADVPDEVIFVGVSLARDVRLGSTTVDQRRSVPRQLYPPIAVAVAAMPKMPAMCQFVWPGRASQGGTLSGRT